MGERTMGGRRRMVGRRGIERCAKKKEADEIERKHRDGEE